jgi:purine/pyrimidine-nucleoside phosphorylase
MTRMTTDKIQATVTTRANVYFDGKCVSHSIELADGTKKSVGVILPSTLKFNTGAPEVMELVDGECRVRLAGAETWTTYAGGQSFKVPGDSSFDIETVKTLHYVCHFG